MGAVQLHRGPLKNLSLGLGVYAVSEQAIAITPNAAGRQWRAPGYATIDAKIGYKWENLTFNVTAKNLANAKVFVPYPYFDGRVAPLAGRAIYATVAATF